MLRRKRWVLAVLIAVFGVVLYPRPPYQLLHPDSYSYIEHHSARGVLYSCFLDGLFENDAASVVRRAGGPDAPGVSNHFARVAWAQWAIFLATMWALLQFLSRWGIVYPLLMTALFFGHYWIFPESHFLGNLRVHLWFVLTEGLSFSWVLGLVLLALGWADRKRSSIFQGVFFGLFCFLGVELSSRFLPLALLAASSALVVGLFGSLTVKARQSILGAVPLATCVLCLIVRFSVTWWNYGVFSQTPLNAVSITAVAIQFGDASLENEFSDPLQREYVHRIFNHRYRAENLSDGHEINWVNRNLYGIGLGAYEEMTGINIGPDRMPEYNRFIDPIVKKIMAAKVTRGRWWSWLKREIVWLWEKRAFISPWHLFLVVWFFGLAAMQTVKRPLTLALGVLSLMPVANLVLSLSLQGFEARYPITGELLVPILSTFAIVALAETTLKVLRRYFGISGNPLHRFFQRFQHKGQLGLREAGVNP